MVRARRFGFEELVSQQLRDATASNVFDLEDHIGAFTFVLPRVRVIPLDSFDPERFLWGQPTWGVKRGVWHSGVGPRQRPS